MSMNKARFLLPALSLTWGIISLGATVANSAHMLRLSDEMAFMVPIYAFYVDVVAITLLQVTLRLTLSLPIFPDVQVIVLIGRTILGSLVVVVIGLALVLFALVGSSKAEADAVSNMAFNVAAMTMSVASAFGALVGWNCLPLVVRKVANSFSNFVGLVIRPSGRRSS